MALMPPESRSAPSPWHRAAPRRRTSAAGRRVPPDTARLRAAGNRWVLQTRLIAGPTGDALEREADRLADAVARTGAAGFTPMPDAIARETRVEAAAAPVPGRTSPGPGPVLPGSRPVSPGSGSASPGPDPVPSRSGPSASGAAPEVSPDLAHTIEGMRGRGGTLPQGERAFFETRLGYDFGPVRIHGGPAAAYAARALGARAFTVGSDVFLGAGEYAPGSAEGRRLLAHELSHVVQQGAARGLERGPGGPSGDAPIAAGLSPGSVAARVQRLRLTRGQFGRELERYQNAIGIPDRPLRTIWRSSIFRNMMGTLDRHYVGINEPTLPTYFEVDADGRLINDAGLNGRWAGSGRRVIHIWSSGVDESSSFEPASRTTMPYDMMWLHDFMYRPNMPAAGRVQVDGTFIESLAHEVSHAHNLVTGVGHGAAGPNPTLAARIAAAVQEEALTRRQESRVVEQVQRGGGLRGFQPTAGSTVPREVERSFVSGTPRRTYLEMFFFTSKLNDAIQSLTDAEARETERIVARIPLTAASAARYLDRNEPIFYFDASTPLFRLLTSDYGKWLFWQRVVHERWTAFEALANPAPAEKERILREHARAYFDAGVAYTP